jgi:uncharacterized membrane protein
MPRDWHWQKPASRGKGANMVNDTSDSTRPPARAGGVFMALGTLAGTVIGGFMGQPSIGFLAGLGGGFALHGALWYMDRRKR